MGPLWGPRGIVNVGLPRLSRRGPHVGKPSWVCPDLAHVGVHCVFGCLLGNTLNSMLTSKTIEFACWHTRGKAPSTH